MLQALCLVFFRHLKSRRGPSALLLLLAVCTFTLSSFAQNQASNSYDSLELQIKQWASTQPGFRGREVSLAPIDSRITIQACQQMLQFEQAFPGQPSVRVKCLVPSWQIFVTLTDSTNSRSDSQNKLQNSKQKVLVAHEALKRGTLLNPSMFSLVQMTLPISENQLVQDPKLVSNTELVRDLLSDTPLRTYDIKNAILVKRGQDVVVTAGSGQGFLISVKAEALQDGGINETIRLKNVESGRLLSAEVTGPGTARLK